MCVHAYMCMHACVRVHDKNAGELVDMCMLGNGDVWVPHLIIIIK